MSKTAGRLIAGDLHHAAACYQVDDGDYYSKDEQQMNQAAGYVEAPA